MSRQSGLLLIVLMALTIFIAWSATEPNHYMMRPGTEPLPQPYPWNYPAWLVLFGIAVIGSVSFKKTLVRLVGVLVSFLFGGSLVVLLAMTVMHSPPVHEDLLYVIFLSSLGLLFYLGYTVAIWRQQGSGHDDAR